jgi:hypothetical protein
MSDNFDPKASIKVISDKLEQPEKFAEILSNTLEKSKTADVAIRKIIIDLLKKDAEIKEELEKVIGSYNKKETVNLWKSIGAKIFFGIWTLFTIAFSILISFWLKKP